MKFNSYLAGVVMALAMTAHGADDAPPPSYFRTLGLDVDLTGLVYLRGEETVPLEVNGDRRSGYFELPGGVSGIAVGELKAGDDGKPKFVELSRIPFPAGQRRLLILFSADPGGKAPWKTTVIPDGLETIPAGGYRFINLLDVPAGIILGEEKEILPPGETVVSEAKPSGNQLIFQARVYKLPGGDPTIVYSNIWGVDPEQRHLVIISGSTTIASGVEVKRLSEYVASIPDDSKDNSKKP